MTRQSLSDGWASGPFAVDYEHRVDVGALRSNRLQRARAEMASEGLDGLLVWKDENVRYLTSLRPQLIAGKSGILNGVLLAGDQPPILFVSGGDRARVIQGMPWLGEVWPIPILEEPGLIYHFVEVTLDDVFRRHRLTRARIGLDLASQALHTALRETFHAVDWTDGDAVMRRARMIKFPEEIALLEEATAIADAVTETALQHIRPGVREVDVAAEALRTLYRLGGEYPHVITPFVASGERMSPPTRLATDKVIRHGDLVFVDIGAMFNGYFSDVARTVICGIPGTDQRRVYRAVHEAHLAGLDAMRPGVTNRQVAEVIRRAAARHSLEDHFLTLFIGHGIGVGANEPPYIGEPSPGASEVELRPGMVFATEPLIWLPGVRGGGGVRLEDMVLVTEGEPHLFSRLPYDHRLLE